MPTPDELTRTKALLRMAQRHAHTADAERAETQANLLEAQAHAAHADARAARSHAEAVNARAAVAEVRRLCDLTISASARVQAIDQARDTLAVLDSITGADQLPGDGAWGTVWLEGNWRWLTKKMSTPEREHAADAVARWSAALNAQDSDLESGEPDGLRWWRD